MNSKDFISRRVALRGLVATAVATALPLPLNALTKDSSVQLVKQLVGDLISVTRSGAADASAARQFKKLIDKYSELPVVARYSLGVQWKSATASQKTKFVRVFPDFLIRRYSHLLFFFQIRKINILRTNKVKTGYLVKSRVHLIDGSSYSVAWQIANIRGRDVLVNFSVAGISMLSAERSEIRSMLENRGNNLDRLITDLDRLGNY